MLGSIAIGVKTKEGVVLAVEKRITSTLLTERLKKCPQCRFPIEHGGGCKQMTCRHCTHEFCYTCGAACRKNKKLTCGCSRSGK